MFKCLRIETYANLECTRTMQTCRMRRALSSDMACKKKQRGETTLAGLEPAISCKGTNALSIRPQGQLAKVKEMHMTTEAARNTKWRIAEWAHHLLWQGSVRWTYAARGSLTTWWPKLILK